MLKHKVEHVQLPSGLEGLIIDTPKTGVVVAEISFRAGEFMLSDEKWETAHLMEHVLLGANRYYDRARDFQAAIEQNGAHSNASTSVYDITYEVEAADFEWQRVIGLLCDAISTPAFKQDEFDSELSNVREELIGRSNNHFRHLNLGLRQVMGMRALTDDQRIELLPGVTREDLIAHYKKTHTLANARFIIAGHFQGKYDEVLELLQERLQLSKGDKRIAMPLEEPCKPEEPFVVRRPSVANIYLYFDAYIPRVVDTVESQALKVASTMLTDTMYSRIFGTARERGWVYDMGSGAVRVGGATAWWVGTQVSRTHSEPLLRLVRDEMINLREGHIDQADFTAAKQHLLGKHMRGGQTARGLVAGYGRFYEDDLVFDLNNISKQLESVRPEKVHALFKEFATAELWAVGLLGQTSLVPARKLQRYLSDIFA